MGNLLFSTKIQKKGHRLKLLLKFFLILIIDFVIWALGFSLINAEFNDPVYHQAGLERETGGIFALWTFVGLIVNPIITVIPILSMGLTSLDIYEFGVIGMLQQGPFPKEMVIPFNQILNISAKGGAVQITTYNGKYNVFAPKRITMQAVIVCRERMSQINYNNQNQPYTNNIL